MALRVCDMVTTLIEMGLCEELELGMATVYMVQPKI